MSPIIRTKLAANGLNDGPTGAPVDAKAFVTLREDKLEAYLRLEPPENGGAQLTYEDLRETLKNANVYYGIDQIHVQMLAVRPVYGKNHVIATGKAPVPGKNASITYQFNAEEAIARPRVNPDGTIDFHDLGLIKNVRKGDTLCVITPPKEGIPGTAVTGEPIRAVSGEPLSPPLGANTVLSDDGTRVIADANGQVSLAIGVINVQNTFIVQNDVDNSTGNIKFVGNVVIYGNVNENLVVQADGSVEIGGTVDGGTVLSGGDINVHAGIVGMHHSSIRAKGNLTSAFIEKADVTVGGDLQTGNLMDCTVKCQGDICVRGLYNRIVGGRYVVGGNVAAETIGSGSHILTELVLGSAPTVTEHHRDLENQLPILRTQILKLNQIINLLNQYQAQGDLGAEKAAMLEKSKATLKLLNDQLRQSELELKLIDAAIEKSQHGIVECSGTLHGGVKLSIGFAKLDVEESIKACRLANQDGSICVLPLA